MGRESDGGSYKDPSGFIYQENGEIYRQVNLSYKEDFDLFLSSGLYDKLATRGWIVGHEEQAGGAAGRAALPDGAYRIIKPERIPFISYPYEWSFSMLKDAALRTLEIQELALERGMSLKDASAFNIQFLRGRPILIDTLSFERYPEGQPWVAYGQFCRHFLAPLALMAHADVRLQSMLPASLDGIPMDTAARLLAGKARFSLGLALHIRAHAGSEKSAARGAKPRAAVGSGGSGAQGGAPGAPVKGAFSLTAMRALIDSLKTTVEKLSWEPEGTRWSDYYDITNYTEAAFSSKKDIVGRFLRAAGGSRTVIDLGANDGTFSRIASGSGRPVISTDIDPAGVEKNYLTVKRQKEENLLPLLLDAMNPSPALGWMNAERKSFLERAGGDSTVMALALVHHLAIGGNVPLPRVADLLARLGAEAIVELVPKEDSQVREMLANRKDVFPGYTEEGFTAAMKERFSVEERIPVESSARVMFRLKRKARV